MNYETGTACWIATAEVVKMESISIWSITDNCPILMANIMYSIYFIMEISIRVREHLNINTLRPRQYGRRFPDDIFKCIFLNENVWIPIKMFVPKGLIKNIPAMVQIMAWRRPGASHYLNQWWLVYRRIYASLGLNELRRPLFTAAILSVDSCWFSFGHNGGTLFAAKIY